MVSDYYSKKAQLPKSASRPLRSCTASHAAAKTGAVTLSQRFGGSLNLNVHFHMLFIDGTYGLSDEKEPTDFFAADPPTLVELAPVLEKIIRRLTKYLERKGIIAKDNDQPFQLEISDEDVFSKLQASSVTYRFATGPSKGKKAMVLRTLPDEDHVAKSGLVVKNSGFSLHAGVAAKANERDKLERICRYIARPAVSEDRLSLNARGEVVYRFKKPWDDGTTAIKLTQMEFLERLVALVPRPRVHLTRYHGVLGPHYKYRKLIVPKTPTQPELTLVGNSDGKPKEPKRISWARLLKRVFSIDIETCPKCAGKMKVIAAIEDPKVIKKILKHLGLPTEPPPLHPARGPPLTESGDLAPQEFFDNYSFPNL